MRILCFEIKFVGFGRKDNREWKSLAKAGDPIGAIREHLRVHGCDLQESRDAVWKYLKKPLQ